MEFQVLNNVFVLWSEEILEGAQPWSSVKLHFELSSEFSRSSDVNPQTAFLPTQLAIAPTCSTNQQRWLNNSSLKPLSEAM